MLGFQTQVKGYDEIVSSGNELWMEPSNLNLDEVVVSATRWSRLHQYPFQDHLHFAQ